MANKTIEQLKAEAAVVRDATEEKENTALRIGTVLIDMIDTLSESVSINAIKGFVVIDSTSELPENPTPEQQQKGYLLDTTLYVYVGEGGDTLEGKYRSAELKGADGAPGAPGPKGDSGVHLGDVALVNDLKTGGEGSALTAEMGKVLGERACVEIVSEGEIDVIGKKGLTLDSICYEGKTYRQIFESGFYYDAERSFADAGIEEYLNRPQSNIPQRSQTVVDSGEYSLYCLQAVGTSSCLRQKSNNSYLLPPKKEWYVACRINVPTITLTAGKNNTIAILESASLFYQNTPTDGWVTLSNFVTNELTKTYGKLYFGLFGAHAGDAYLDTLVTVRTDMFSVKPSQAQLDDFYNTYVQIKKGVGSIENSTTIISSPALVNRTLLPNYGFADLECMQEFISELNGKAHKLGMTDSTFSNPYGGDKYGYNWTTVEDMMKMIVYAASYPRVLDYMSQNTHVNLPIYGSQARTEVYPETANSFLDGIESAYHTKHGAGSAMPYLALSHKGAGWGDLNNKDATSKVRGCVGTAIVGTHHVAYCVFQAASAYQSSGTYYRAIVDLLDICKAYFDGGDTSGMDVSNYNYAMAVELPTLNPECYKNNFALDTIYLKRVLDNGSEVKFNTASAAKVLSTMVMLDALGDDLHQIIEVNSYDESYDNTFWNPNDSGDFEGHAGDKLTLDSALYAILGYSNGVFTLATARHAGAKMLYNKLLKGIGN